MFNNYAQSYMLGGFCNDSVGGANSYFFFVLGDVSNSKLCVLVMFYIYLNCEFNFV